MDTPTLPVRSAATPSARAAPVTVDAGSGDVGAAGLTAALVLHTGSGDVLATGTRSARVRASTGSGDVTDAPARS